ncbi:MAG: LON peptidase substrate-binding domain-containing protein [Chitinophagaceae bacterium]|nr:LON peptidase substrate-binding domain-containing protein [Chitinophagaceae bacterium]
MTNFIPIFPLSIVVYPGEALNLHVFEPRYTQLINDCHTNQKPFGIPVVMNNQTREMGTLMKITNIDKVYDNGEMDVRTEGIQVFKILETIETVPDKLYKGAIVTYPENKDNGLSSLMEKVLAFIKTLHQLLHIRKDFKKEEAELRSFDIAHHTGLSLEQEYQLLEYTDELHRQEFLKRHLVSIIPVVAETEALKKKIKLNGHFKTLSS